MTGPESQKHKESLRLNHEPEAAAYHLLSPSSCLKHHSEKIRLSRSSLKQQQNSNTFIKKNISNIKITNVKNK